MQTLTPFPWPLVNEVHIHCAALDTEAARYVSPDELLRAGRFLDPQKRNSFIAGRGLLREILSRYLGGHPEELNFTEGEHGKPYLSDSPANNGRLHFNLSHSGALFLLAIAADLEVGIDIEQLRNDTPFPDMARLAFSPHELSELIGLPLHKQRSAFYRCWTRKEAYMKACGTGFSQPSNSFVISLLSETPISLISPVDQSRFFLQDINVPDDYCAALATQGSTAIIRYIGKLSALE